MSLMTPRKREEYHQVIDKYAEANRQCCALLKQICAEDSALYHNLLDKMWSLCSAYTEFDRVRTGDSEIDAYIAQVLAEFMASTNPTR